MCQALGKDLRVLTALLSKPQDKAKANGKVELRLTRNICKGLRQRKTTSDENGGPWPTCHIQYKVYNT